MKSLLLLSLFLLVAGCARPRADAPFFHVEPKYQFTFGHIGNLAVGDKLNLNFTKLAPNDVFHINKCGTPCNTSKVAFYVEGKEFQTGERSFDITENGSYYFWVQRTLDGGEVGPSHIDNFDANRMQFKAIFMTGTIISGGLERRPN